MPRAGLRRIAAMATRRSCRLGIEVLEDRLAPAVLNQLAVFSQAVHGDYDPPAVDASGNVYTVVTNKSGQQSLIKVTGGSQTTIPSETSDGVLVAPGGFNAGLVVDSDGNVFGPASVSDGSGSLFELPAGTNQYQVITAEIDGNTTGIIDPPLMGLAVGGGNLYGLTAGVLASNESEEGASVWSYPLAGGNVTILATWLDPVPFQDGPLAFGDGLTLSNNVLYGMVGDYENPGNDSLFAVPVTGVPDPTSRRRRVDRSRFLTPSTTLLGRVWW